MASGTAISVNIGHNRAEAGATQINNVTNNFAPDVEQIDQDCLRALQCPDPFRVKNELKASKDILLRESFEWILHDPYYLDWYNGQDVALLWIKGGAGKGKTMMSIGLIEELSQVSHDSPVIIYFFCQNADSSLNTVSAILKGLMHQLIRERPHAAKELRARWDHGRKQWITSNCDPSFLSPEELWHVLLAMLDRCKHDRIFIFVDALDECEGNIAQLLKQIVSTGLTKSSNVKWLLTSRPMDVAEQILLARSNQSQVSLEVNLDRLAKSVAAYVSVKVAELARSWRTCPKDLRQRIENDLTTKAEATFLWVSFMCKELQHVDVDDALSTIDSAPAGLQAVYERAYRDVRTGHPADVAGCTQLLRVMMLAFRPLNLPEVYSLINLDTGDERLELWVARCASFVQVRGEEISHLAFTHQSARDYLADLTEFSSNDATNSIDHHEIARRCLRHLTDKLAANLLLWPHHEATRDKDWYGLIPRSLPETSARCELPPGFAYAAEYWFEHFQKVRDLPSLRTLVADNGPIDSFLRRCLLEWLAFLALRRQLARADRALQVLASQDEDQDESLVPGSAAVSDDSQSFTDVENTNQRCHRIATASYKFLIDHESTISCSPEQISIVALIFTPKVSLIRELNSERLPQWLRRFPAPRPVWSPFRFVPESRDPLKVMFSPDGLLVASTDENPVVRLWNCATGTLQYELRDHTKRIITLAFSPDGQRLASGSEDTTIKLWETQTGRLESTFEGHLESVTKVIFSSDGHLIVSMSHGGTIKVWETQTRVLRRTLHHPDDSAVSVVLSPDGHLIASASVSGTIKLWETWTGRDRQTIQAHVRRAGWRSSSGDRHTFKLLAFSPDANFIACERYDAISVWKVARPFSIMDLFRGDPGQQAMYNIYFSGNLLWLRFSQDGSHIITNRGSYKLSDALSYGRLNKMSDDSNELYFLKDGWIVCGSTRLLFLPPDYATVGGYSSREDEIAFATRNGQFWIFDIDRKLALSCMRS